MSYLEVEREDLEMNFGFSSKVQQQREIPPVLCCGIYPPTSSECSQRAVLKHFFCPNLSEPISTSQDCLEQDCMEHRPSQSSTTRKAEGKLTQVEFVWCVWDEKSSKRVPHPVRRLQRGFFCKMEGYQQLHYKSLSRFTTRAAYQIHRLVTNSNHNFFCWGGTTRKLKSEKVRKPGDFRVLHTQGGGLGWGGVTPETLKSRTALSLGCNSEKLKCSNEGKSQSPPSFTRPVIYVTVVHPVWQESLFCLIWKIPCAIWTYFSTT